MLHLHGPNVYHSDKLIFSDIQLYQVKLLLLTSFHLAWTSTCLQHCCLQHCHGLGQYLIFVDFFSRC